jgi:hypothetical protein
MIELLIASIVLGDLVLIMAAVVLLMQFRGR